MIENLTHTGYSSYMGYNSIYSTIIHTESVFDRVGWCYYDMIYNRYYCKLIK